MLQPSRGYAWQIGAEYCFGPEARVLHVQRQKAANPVVAISRLLEEALAVALRRGDAPDLAELAVDAG